MVCACRVGRAFMVCAWREERGAVRRVVFGGSTVPRADESRCPGTSRAPGGEAVRGLAERSSTVWDTGTGSVGGAPDRACSCWT